MKSVFHTSPLYLNSRQKHHNFEKMLGVASAKIDPRQNQFKWEFPAPNWTKLGRQQVSKKVSFPTGFERILHFNIESFLGHLEHRFNLADEVKNGRETWPKFVRKTPKRANAT